MTNGSLRASLRPTRISYESLPRPRRASGRSTYPAAWIPRPTSKGFHDAPNAMPTWAPMSPMSGRSSWYCGPALPPPAAGGGGPAGSWAAEGAAMAATRAKAAIERKGFVASSGDRPPDGRPGRF